MKNKDLLIIGALAIGAFFLMKYFKGNGTEGGGGGGGDRGAAAAERFGAADVGPVEAQAAGDGAAGDDGGDLPVLPDSGDDAAQRGADLGGTADLEGADFRACANFGALYGK